MTDVSNMAPPERWQHGTEFEIGHDGLQRVRSPVNVLRQRGKVSDADVASAERYYRDYAIGWENVIGESSTSWGDHLMAFIAARNAAGAYRGWLALTILCDVMPLPHETAIVVAALQDLTAYYAQIDGGVK